MMDDLFTIIVWDSEEHGGKEVDGLEFALDLLARAAQENDPLIVWDLIAQVRSILRHLDEKRS